MKAEFKKPENRDRKYFLLKHHYWMNFEEFNVTQPTFINVIREPTSWFTSRYYFQRYGWNRNVDSRRNGSFKQLKFRNQILKFLTVPRVIYRKKTKIGRLMSVYWKLTMNAQV